MAIHRRLLAALQPVCSPATNGGGHEIA